MVTAVAVRATGGAGRLAAALAEWSDERLEALLVARPDLCEPPPATMASLAARAESGPSLSACLEHLDLWCLQVLDGLCLLDLPADERGLLSLLGHPLERTDLDRALGRLESLALVLRSGDGLRPVGTLLARAPAGLGPPARQLLGARANTDLGAIARRLGARPGRTKAETLDALLDAYADAESVRKLVGAGPKGTDELVQELAWRHPVVSVPYGTSYPEDRTPVGWLVNRGMLAPLGWSSAAMPREVGLALRGGRPFPTLAPRPPDLGGARVDPVAADAAGAEKALALVGDLASALDAFDDAPARLLKAGGVGIRDVRRAAKAAGRPEAAAARLIELAGVAGLVAPDGAAGVALPTAAYDQWLALEAPARWARLAAAWLSSQLHLSVAGASDHNDKPIPPLLQAGGDPAAAQGRRLLLATLAGTHPGIAVEPACLQQAAIWAGPMAWTDGPASAPVLVGWALAEAEMLGLVAHGALTTAGRRVAEGDLDGATRALAELAPTVVDHFVLQADLTAMAPGELAPSVRAELELLADVESTGAATVFRFSEASLRRAFGAGRAACEILAFLEAHASKGVPQPLSFLVADLGRRFGQVRAGRAGCYVRSDDPSLLTEISRSRRAATLGLRPLAPTVLVSGAAPEKVVTVLRDAGYLAAEEDADGGLVLAATARGRAPGARLHGPGPGPAARSADPAAVVARLRAARPVAAGEEPDVADALLDALFALELPLLEAGELERPTSVARQAHAVRALAELAWEEGWLLRMGYADSKGRDIQVSAAITDVRGDIVCFECPPDWRARSLPVGRVQWARALTDAEEEQLL